MDTRDALLLDDQVAELALWSVDAEAGDWSQRALLRLATRRGWDVDVDPVIIHTDLPTGKARLLRTTGEARYGFRGEFAGMAVPVGCAGASELAQAERFRHIANVVRSALGPASVLGSYGTPYPSGTAEPAWGKPFLRWLRPSHSVELRAGSSGPEIVLASTEHWTDWLAGQQRDRTFTGFLARLRTNDSGLHPVPSSLPPPTPWRAPDWEVFESAFAAWLSTVAAEQHAVDMPLVPAVHGSGGLLVDVFPEPDRLLIGGAAETVDMPAFGWVPGPFPGEPWDVDYPGWRLVGGGIGHPDGPTIARKVVATARAAGLDSPANLLIRHGVRAETPDGAKYDVTFCGLGIETHENAW